MILTGLEVEDRYYDISFDKDTVFWVRKWVTTGSGNATRSINPCGKTARRVHRAAKRKYRKKG